MSRIELNLVVIRASDLERAQTFYEVLGIHFVREQHGVGPEHLVTELPGTVLEIYPMGGGPSSEGTRLGFRVPSVDDVIERIESVGGSVLSQPLDSPWGRRAVIADPEGHLIELTDET